MEALRERIRARERANLSSTPPEPASQLTPDASAQPVVPQVATIGQPATLPNDPGVSISPASAATHTRRSRSTTAAQEIAADIMSTVTTASATNPRFNDRQRLSLAPASLPLGTRLARIAHAATRYGSSPRRRLHCKSTPASAAWDAFRASSSPLFPAAFSNQPNDESLQNPQTPACSSVVVASREPSLGANQTAATAACSSVASSASERS